MSYIYRYVLVVFTILTRRQGFSIVSILPMRLCGPSIFLYNCITLYNKKYTKMKYLILSELVIKITIQQIC
jgi:hypothetical protein